MKSSVLKIKVLSGVGLLGLLSCLYFEFPVYGYVIWATLLAIYVYTQFKNLKNLSVAQNEIESINSMKDTGATTVPADDSIIYERYSLLKDLKEKNGDVDLSTFSDILSAKVSSKLGSSAANLTITLGLLGTFFGLMGAISTAGASMSESFQIQTLITTIFSDMNGIFGTSLSGLMAFMILSVANGVVKNAYIEMMAEIEEYTHFYLIPQFATEKENEYESLIDSLSNNLSNFVDNLGSQLNTHSVELSSAISDKLESSFDKLQDSIKESNSSVIEQLSGSHKSALDDIINQHKESAQEVVTTQKELLGSFSKQIEQSATTILNVQKELSTNTSSEIASRLEDLKNSIDSIPEAQKALTLNTSDEITNRLEELKDVITAIPEAQKETITEQMNLLDTHQEKSRELQKEHLSHNQEQMDTVFEKTTEFTESLKESINMISRDGFSKLQEEFVTLAQAAKDNFEIQEKLGKELEEQYSTQMSSLQNFTENITEGGSLMKINQVEFQASLEMFNLGVESLVEHVSTAEPEEQGNFYEKLETTLEAFHEKASEVLVENALKTQEILIEVLEQVKLQGESIEAVDQEAEA